jgi:16S rRNA processing protein RimM
MDVLTDFPERLRVGKTVLVGDAHAPMKLAGVRGHNRELIVRLEGISTPEDVARLRNALVFVLASDLPRLPKGEYYHHQLLGLTIVNEAQAVLGMLDSILETGANDVYVVKTPEGKELLLPAVDDVILEVDLTRRQMVVRPPEWL